MNSLVLDDYSIAEARDQLARIVYDAEAGQIVRLTRRGKPVAVLVSVEEYERLSAKATPPSLWQAIMSFRDQYRVADGAYEADAFEGVRELRDSGRAVEL